MKLFLFGAGASIPFYPTLNTNYLTEQIGNWENWKRIIELYNQNSTYKIDYTQILSLLESIKSNTTDANFEEICGYIDSITDILTDLENKSNDKYDKITNTLLKCKIINLNLSSISNIKYLPYLFRCLIIDTFLKVRKSGNYCKLIAQQEKFIKALTGKSKKASIISLNYDNILNETIGTVFYNGYHETQPNFMPFSFSSFFQADKTISYLHGNIKFYYTLPDIKYSFEKTFNTKERIEMLFPQKYLSEQHFPYNIENHSYNVFITTGIEKNISMDYLPYSAYYTKFTSDICKSSSIISIGYSFRDQHVNRILSSFLNMKKKNKIIIVDYNESNNISLNDFFSEGNILYEIYRVFLCQIPTDNRQEFININTKGYGFVTDQILYYKLGYEFFLNEYNNVINYFNSGK